MSNELAVNENKETASPSVATSDMLFADGMLEKVERFAKMMAAGKATLPVHLQGNEADCLAIVIQAAQWGMNPFAVAQKTHLVSGTLGYEAQLVNAVLQSTNSIDGRFHYEYRGEGNALECRVGATPHGESEIEWNEWLNIKNITVKNSPLWKTNPKQQIGYLQVKNWARLYCPGAIMGVYTPDELATIQPREIDVTPADKINNYMTDVDQKSEALLLVDRIIKAIATAKSTKQLKAAISDVEMLSSGNQSIVRDEYKKKVDSIRASRDTGEITYALLTDQLGKAKTADDIESVEDLANALPADQTKEIKSLCDAARAGLNN